MEIERAREKGGRKVEEPDGRGGRHIPVTMTTLPFTLLWTTLL